MLPAVELESAGFGDDATGTIIWKLNFLGSAPVLGAPDKSLGICAGAVEKGSLAGGLAVSPNIIGVEVPGSRPLRKVGCKSFRNG